jgi:hypothetical protein
METGLLHLHNLLRWVILIAMIVAIVQLLLKKDAIKASKVLLISAHSTLVLGLYQYFFGPIGFFFIKTMGMAEVMKDTKILGSRAYFHHAHCYYSHHHWTC